MIADHTQKEKPMKNQQDTNNNINDAFQIMMKNSSAQKEPSQTNPDNHFDVDIICQSNVSQNPLIKSVPKGCSTLQPLRLCFA
jgi:NAD(P)H-nitrite reductase large subunit